VTAAAMRSRVAQLFGPETKTRPLARTGFAMHLRCYFLVAFSVLLEWASCDALWAPAECSWTLKECSCSPGVIVIHAAPLSPCGAVSAPPL
jgi:hypothetical protein